ncbi:type II toxin-antitoxin system VapC family toxin [Azospirillum halopraeferens]|uniref:type II toxin-antitoxin system VapC family toxin n=1 Tax=Azospirillum halopraeferens TaxID=34010 RepID=UPI001FDEE280|nr:type II toxin-antitoxin system VapC family toxin [Azospirillum halopraeferens]
MARILARAHAPRMSAANIVEAAIVLKAKKRIPADEAERRLDLFVSTSRLRIEPVTVEQAGAARSAHTKFGKGTGHPAALNFGDCFAYALARTLNAPLLYVGNDFAMTDITSAGDE